MVRLNSPSLCALAVVSDLSCSNRSILIRWNESEGPFAPLHQMNAARCKFIREAVCRHFGRDAGARQPFADLRLLDVGCGGGLLCVPPPRSQPVLLPRHRTFT